MVCVARCWGQTNRADEVSPGFFLPPVRLRLEKPEPAEPAKDNPATLTLSSPGAAAPQAAALSASLPEPGLQSRVFRSDRFYLERLEARPDTGMEKIVDRIFTPEVVHLGKIPITGSIVTAIKRKNPLCLLNPIVFQMSW